MQLCWSVIAKASQQASNYCRSAVPSSVWKLNHANWAVSRFMFYGGPPALTKLKYVHSVAVCSLLYFFMTKHYCSGLLLHVCIILICKPNLKKIILHITYLFWFQLHLVFSIFSLVDRLWPLLRGYLLQVYSWFAVLCVSPARVICNSRLVAEHSAVLVTKCCRRDSSSHSNSASLREAEKNTSCSRSYLVSRCR